MADQIEDDNFATIETPPLNKAPPSITSARPERNPDRPRAGVQESSRSSGVTQPKPQALPKRSGPSSIIVSPRQKGNPVLNHIKSLPWEYGDIPADFVLGLTTCALFLQLKYHKLHPEYIYNRIKQLAGRYSLRLIFVLVDIENHEESLKELTKTSLINNVTLILFWSAAEGGRYLELFKTYENAAPTSIKQHQSTTYSDRMVDFVTIPRSINKTDAVSLVSQFGTIRTAVNARHEDVAGIAGWGEKKVDRWCKAVREPFRVKKAAKRGLDRETSSAVPSQPISRAVTLSRDATRDEHESFEVMQNSTNDSNLQVNREAMTPPNHDAGYTVDADPHENITHRSSITVEPPSKRKKYTDESVSDGVMAALSKLRER